ncbi:MAG: VOC family protein [Chloroflexi bacterium]|nr:VOC family protein [Chloroflexota bacterium]
MITSIDHIVILVHDLVTATADYAALGFTVTPGGEHTGGATHNALVAFADGSYLELIAFRREAPEHIWWRHVANGEGIIDFALLPESTAGAIADARARGLEIAGPFPGGRERPDGVRLEWQTGRATTPDLPFLCGDVTPRTLRVPSGAAHHHANGVAGIARVLVAVTNPAASAARYRALLGIEGGANATSIEFSLAHSAIVLVPAGATTRNDDGPFALDLRGGAQGTLEPSHTHGARIRTGA